MFGGLKNYTLWWTNSGIVRHVSSHDLDVLVCISDSLRMDSANYSMYIS